MLSKDINKKDSLSDNSNNNLNLVYMQCWESKHTTKLMGNVEFILNLLSCHLS